ncbi:MAG: molybdopterin-dependent oxidoreductase [Candidatus Thorarchaeota archaeon]
MEKRNFYLLIASICIGISLFWLFTYSYIILDVNPSQNTIIIKGKVSNEIDLTLSDLKSDKYLQIRDKTFHIVNAIGREYDLVFSGVSLWSIFEVENILQEDAKTFLFIGGDGYYAETPLDIQLAQDYPNQIILAYEQDGQPLFYDGPIRSVVDHEVIPDKANTHYAIKELKTILIQ